MWSVVTHKTSTFLKSVILKNSAFYRSLMHFYTQNCWYHSNNMHIHFLLITIKTWYDPPYYDKFHSNLIKPVNKFRPCLISVISERYVHSFSHIHASTLRTTSLFVALNLERNNASNKDISCL